MVVKWRVGQSLDTFFVLGQIPDSSWLSSGWNHGPSSLVCPLISVLMLCFKFTYFPTAHLLTCLCSLHLRTKGCAQFLDSISQINSFSIFWSFNMTNFQMPFWVSASGLLLRSTSWFWECHFLSQKIQLSLIYSCWTISSHALINIRKVSVLSLYTSTYTLTLNHEQSIYRQYLTETYSISLCKSKGQPPCLWVNVFNPGSEALWCPILGIWFIFDSKSGTNQIPKLLRPQVTIYSSLYFKYILNISLLLWLWNQPPERWWSPTTWPLSLMDIFRFQRYTTVIFFPTFLHFFHPSFLPPYLYYSLFSFFSPFILHSFFFFQ